MPEEVISPSGPWNPGRQPFTLDGALSGMGNLGGWRGAIDTENQRLSADLRLTTYQLVSESTSWDFFAAFGSLTHGVLHSEMPYVPSRNWVSVGYYATEMSVVLDLAGHPEKAVVWDAGPTSTVGQNSVGFNIGGNLSGGSFAGEPIIQAGVSGSFGATFSSPDVRFATSQVGQLTRWDVSLPGVGYVSPAVPANPEGPSYAGYKWYFGAIYAVPKGDGFRLSVRPTVKWEFDYTRGITYDTKIWSPEGDETLFTFVPPPPPPART